jgi:hypothetical protein
MRRTLFLGAIIAIAVVIADLDIYQWFVVPRLVNWSSVPIYWRAIVHIPVMLALAMVAAMVTGSRQLIAASGAAAVLCTLYLALGGRDLPTGTSQELGQRRATRFLDFHTTLASARFRALGCPDAPGCDSAVQVV